MDTLKEADKLEILRNAMLGMYGGDDDTEPPDTEPEHDNDDDDDNEDDEPDAKPKQMSLADWDESKVNRDESGRFAAHAHLNSVLPGHRHKLNSLSEHEAAVASAWVKSFDAKGVDGSLKLAKRLDKGDEWLAVNGLVPLTFDAGLQLHEQQHAEEARPGRLV